MNAIHSQIFGSSLSPPSQADLHLNVLFDNFDRGLGLRSAQEDLQSLLKSYATNLEEGFAPFLKSACKSAILRFSKETDQIALRLSDTNFTSKAVNYAKELDAKGILYFEMKSSKLQSLISILSPLIESCRAESLNNPDFVLAKPISDSDAKKLILNFCNENFIMESLSCLYGFQFGSIGFSYHLSYHEETWFRLFDDLTITPTRTTQFHYDMEYAIPKAMLYLNDVGPEEGPFGFCQNPPQANIKGFRLCLAKEVISSISDFVLAKGQLDVGKPLWRSPLARRILASLPTPIRQISIPADFFFDDTELSEALLGSETQVTGKAGLFTIFTGGHLLHRGGLVKSGERHALQVCFYPKEEVHYKKAPTPSPRRGRKFSNEDFSRTLVAVCPERDIIAIDVGGAVEMQPHWLRLPKVSRTYVFEPHVDSFLELIERQKIDPTYAYNHYLMIALGGKNGQRTLYKTNQPTGSSLHPPHPDGICNYPENDYLFPITEESIEVQTLESALDIFRLKQVDAIKLDTQGTELEILKGLGPELSKDLLLIEMEIPIIGGYDGDATDLTSTIHFVEELGLDLFDFRCNRFPGNAVRLGKDFLKEKLAADLEVPSMAQRLAEVDAVFFKDPKKLIDEGCSQEKLRRLIVLLAVYYFFPEAVFAAQYASEHDIISEEEKTEILETLAKLHGMARNQSRAYEKHLAERGGLNWGQYMHVPSPST